MADGRSIWAELQREGWAGQDLDYGQVLAELADGRPAFSVLNSRGSGLFFLEDRQVELMDELTAIARAPYELTPPPAEPAVACERLSADFQRTTGRALEFTWRWEQLPTRGVWRCQVSIDGREQSFATVSGDGDPEAALAALADDLCEGWLHEEIWGGWPLCPHHPTRPMWATTDPGGTADWRCEADAADQAVIGWLGRQP